MQGYFAHYQISCSPDDNGGSLKVNNFSPNAGTLIRPHTTDREIPIENGERAGVVVYQNWRETLIHEEEYLEEATHHPGGLEGYRQQRDKEWEENELWKYEETEIQDCYDDLSVRHFRPDLDDKPWLTRSLPEIDRLVDSWLDKTFGGKGRNGDKPIPDIPPDGGGGERRPIEIEPEYVPVKKGGKIAR